MAFRLIFLFVCVATSLMANPAVTVDLSNGVSMVFVRVEAGTFLMGSAASESGRYRTWSDQG